MKKSAIQEIAAMTPAGFRAHEQRAAVLGELHARPFAAMPTPARVYHYAFITDDEESRQGQALVAALAIARGEAPPAADARFHFVRMPPWTLRWERHNEFTSYTWTADRDADAPFAQSGAAEFGTEGFVAGQAFAPPGKLLVAVRLALVKGDAGAAKLESLFHRSSLAVIGVADGAGRVSTDFQVDSNGYTKFLVENLALSETRAGRLVQRVLELETYRTLALLGLPVARAADNVVRRIEQEQAALTRAIGAAATVEKNRQLLTALTDIAAELETLLADTSYRFGASRAYDDLVKSRLDAMREREHPDYVSWSRFLQRRMKPAMETCRVMVQRQNELSVKLARTAELLSTRIQFDLEQQNRTLLQSMNRRARLALRLQQTVEGLSIAAISYYVVGLVGYIAKGVKDAGLLAAWLSPEKLMALAVPVVIVGLWLLLHRARKNWTRPGDDA